MCSFDYSVMLIIYLFFKDTSFGVLQKKKCLTIGERAKQAHCQIRKQVSQGHIHSNKEGTQVQLAPHGRPLATRLDPIVPSHTSTALVHCPLSTIGGQGLRSFSQRIRGPLTTLFRGPLRARCILAAAPPSTAPPQKHDVDCQAEEVEEILVTDAIKVALWQALVDGRPKPSYSLL